MTKRRSKRKVDNKIVAAVVIIMLLIFVALWLYDYFSQVPDDEGGYVYGEGDTAIHFLDVGQADCILIQFPDGKTMMIDAGNANGNFQRSQEKIKIKDYLGKLEITRLDIFMLTHTDADHCGAAGGRLSGGEYDGVLYMSGLTVGKVFMPKVKSAYEGDPLQANSKAITTSSYANFVRAVVEKGAEIVYTAAESLSGLIAEGEGYKIKIYTPVSQNVYATIGDSSSSGDKNKISPIMILEYNGRRVMFTGDATGETETEFLDYVAISGESPAVDVLKVAHHGSSTEGSNSQTFLSAVRPKYAVISSNNSGNNYNHPHADTLTRLTSVGATVFRTDTVGDVVCTLTEDSQILWYTSRDGDITVLAIKTPDFEVLYIWQKR